MINTIDEEEQARRKLALQKNNEDLDRICKTICLFFGWLCVFCLIIYIISMIFTR